MRHPELIFQKNSFGVSPQRLTLREGCQTPGNAKPEELVVALPEHLEPGASIMAPTSHAQRHDAAHVIRSAIVLWNHRLIVWPTLVVCAVEVIERRDSHDGPSTDSVQPGEIHKCVALVFNIPNAC